MAYEKGYKKSKYTAQVKYTAKKGDTISTIADKFKLKNYDVAKANPNVYKVSAGQTVNVPAQPNKASRPTRGGRGSWAMPYAGTVDKEQAPSIQLTEGGHGRGSWAMPYAGQVRINQLPNPMPYFHLAGLTKYGVSPATLGIQAPSYTRPSYWTQGTGWRDVGAGGREGRVSQPAASDWRREWTADDIEKLRRMGYGGRMLAEGIEGRAGSPNMKPLFQTYADYALVPDYPDIGGGDYQDYYGGGGGYGGGYGGGGSSTVGPSWNYSPGGYNYGNFNYATLGLVNWRI